MSSGGERGARGHPFRRALLPNYWIESQVKGRILEELQDSSVGRLSAQDLSEQTQIDVGEGKGIVGEASGGRSNKTHLSGITFDTLEDFRPHDDQ